MESVYRKLFSSPFVHNPITSREANELLRTFYVTRKNQQEKYDFKSVGKGLFDENLQDLKGRVDEICNLRLR